ncbi:MAG: hypothetical protein QXP38_05530 [Nitrososphaerota archaeon]
MLGKHSNRFVDYLTEAMKQQTCPRCGRKGSQHKKMVRNSRGKPYHYIYFAHYKELRGKTRRIKWCYIGREPPTEQVGKKEKEKNTLGK